jgi:phage terminase large subunit-like protein
MIEKINCAYCSYVNGLFGYLQEIAGRTEQFWCPIKHAKRIKNLHSRYQKFIDYGDAKTYRANIETTRHDFKDLE